MVKDFVAARGPTAVGSVAHDAAASWRSLVQCRAQQGLALTQLGILLWRPHREQKGPP